MLAPALGLLPLGIFTGIFAFQKARKLIKQSSTEHLLICKAKVVWKDNCLAELPTSHLNSFPTSGVFRLLKASMNENSNGPGS